MSTLRDKTEIEAWLQKYEITEHTLVPHPHYGYVVNVHAKVNISNCDLDFIPVKFGEVYGLFDCSSNRLTTLENSPDKAHSFFCQKNSLTDLVGGPKTIFSIYDCSRQNGQNGTNGQLQSLKGAPEEVREFNCSRNALTSLQYAPSVRTEFNCVENYLTSLEYGPTHLRSFSCANNKLTTLEHCPSVVSDNFSCANNLLTDLEFCPTEVGLGFYCEGNPGLGSLQETNDFKTIYAHHKLVQKIKQEKSLLQDLIPKDLFSTSSLKNNSLKI